jgi:hypothetical protein
LLSDLDSRGDSLAEFDGTLFLPPCLGEVVPIEDELIVRIEVGKRWKLAFVLEEGEGGADDEEEVWFE